MSKLDEAIGFAASAHANQLRKYTNLPYILHPLEVMEIAATEGGLLGDEPALIAAVLHDVVEDTDVVYETINRRFGAEVTALVAFLTDSPLSAGNRQARKALDRQRLTLADPRAQTIKLADMISNTRSIVQFDPSFARTYLKEKEAMLPCLRQGSPVLQQRAQILLVEGQEHLIQLHLETRGA